MAVHSIRVALAGLFVTLALGGRADAQTLNTVEALGFVGGVTDGGGATFGGGMQVGTARLVVAAEVGYLTLRPGYSAAGVTGDTSAISVDLNAHYRFLLARNRTLTPYLLGGIGILRASFSGTANGVSGSAVDSDLGLNVGGGARVAVTDAWGLRPELKFLVRDHSMARFSVGVDHAFGN